MAYCCRCGKLIDGTGTVELVDGTVTSDNGIQVGHGKDALHYHTFCFSLLHSERIEAEREIFRAQLRAEKLNRNTVETQRWCKQGNQ